MRGNDGTEKSGGQMSEEPSNFSFLNRDPLWDQDEAEKQYIHNLIIDGDDVLKSVINKVKRQRQLRGRKHASTRKPVNT
jgi:hypothetical protein